VRLTTRAVLLLVPSLCLLLHGSEYFAPEHRLSGIGVDRSEISPAVLDERTTRMVQSQTFVIMREPQATQGAERITGPKLTRIFRAASVTSGLPASVIAAIAYLESWGDAQAQSPAGPRGIMQFSEATARAAGLRVARVTRYKIVTERKVIHTETGKTIHRTVRRKVAVAVTTRDDRMNPERAVPAAAQYLARLQNKYNGLDWAIFAYHCGEGCVAELRPLAETAVGHKNPSVAETFFAANPARNKDLYEALQRHMQRDYSPTYWFRVQRAEQLLDLYQNDRDAFMELVDQYRNPVNMQRRANDRLVVWLKAEDLLYKSADDLRLASARTLEQVMDNPEFFNFYPPRLPDGQELYLQASPSAIGTLLYIAFETRRLYEELNPNGEHFVPLQVVELVSTMDHPAEAGNFVADPELPEHSTGYVFDIDRSNLPRGERECLNFLLDDMGWDGYLGFIQVSGDTVHVGCSPSSREFFDLVFQEAAAAAAKPERVSTDSDNSRGR